MKKLVGILTGLFLLGGMGVPASAATFFFTNDNCTGSCGTNSPFASITLTDTGADVDVTLNVLNGNQFNTAGGGHNTFNFSMTPTLTAASITNLTAHYVFVAPANNQDGFGDFKYAITDDGSLGAHNANPISFTILGVNFSDFIQSTGSGAEHVFFTVDIFGTNGNTGLVGSTNLTINPEGENPPDNTPLPGAIWLFAGGLGLLGMLYRKKEKPKSAWA
jgi:hypothetical protein